MFPLHSCDDSEPVVPTAPAPCPGAEACATVYPAACVVYDGDPVECLDILPGERMSTLLPKLLFAVCGDGRVLPVSINPTSSIEVEGNGTAGAPLVLTVRRDPAPHNALRETPEGLLSEMNRSGVKRMLELIRTDNELRALLCSIGCQPTANAGPAVNAGADQIVKLPYTSTTLTGSATDADGFVESFAWEQLHGPAQATIVDPAASQTLVSGLVAGAYIFQLSATDNQGARTTDTVQVTVQAADVCGQPQALTLTLI